jgi:hypothetical protein
MMKKNALALRKTCDIFGAVYIPHFSDIGELERASVGKAENPNSGGRAAWASFYCWSSG